MRLERRIVWSPALAVQAGRPEQQLDLAGLEA